MCNGDLGMYRVMPWAYPTIPGQSSGGTTVDPTPEPSPSKPYDFSNAKITVAKTGTYSQMSKTYRSFFELKISGITTIDSSNVGSVSANKYDISTFVFTPSGGKGGIYLVFSDLNNLNRSGNVICDYQGTAPSSTPTLSGTGTLTLVVYDVSGNKIQEETIVIS